MTNAAQQTEDAIQDAIIGFNMDSKNREEAEANARLIAPFDDTAITQIAAGLIALHSETCTVKPNLKNYANALRILRDIGRDLVIKENYPGAGF